MNKWLMILIFIVVFLLIADLIPVFMGKPFYYENSKLIFEFLPTGDSTLTSIVNIYVKDEKKVNEIIQMCENYKPNDPEREKNIKGLFGEDVSLKSYRCEAKKLSENGINVKEIYGLSGLASRTQNKMIISFGKELNKTPVDTEVVYIIPDGFRILTATPTPTEYTGPDSKVIKWHFKPGEKMSFPLLELKER